MNSSLKLLNYSTDKLSLQFIAFNCILALLILVTLLLIVLLRKSKQKINKLGEKVEQLYSKQAELQTSEQAAQAFVADVSHEIHAALAILQNYAMLIQHDGATEQQRIDFAKIISDEVNQLSELCSQLLLLARLEHKGITLSKQNYPVKDQLRHTLQLFEYQLSHKKLLSTLKIKDNIFIYGDKILLQQVWSNLLSNAIKHTPEEGSITIEVKEDHHHCIVIIKDSGEGLEKPDNGLLFERFYRERSIPFLDGYGLGLSIVKKIIDLHNGQIELNSQENRGTAVTVSLPHLNEKDQ